MYATKGESSSLLPIIILNNNNNNNNRVDLMVGDKTKNKARYEMNNADSTEIY